MTAAFLLRDGNNDSHFQGCHGPATGYEESPWHILSIRLQIKDRNNIDDMKPIDS
jgi:hypothetical protein